MTNSSAAAKPQARLWAFNAGGEEALRIPATQRYSPSKEVRRLRREAAHLLLLLAEPNDYLYRPAGLAGEPAELWDSSGQLVRQLPEGLLVELSPWILEPHILRELRELPQLRGVQLIEPSIDDAYMQLAHRRGSWALLERCVIHLGYPQDLLPLWVEAAPSSLGRDRQGQTTAAALVAASASLLERGAGVKGQAILKRPFSSSGRGVAAIDLPLEGRPLEQALGSCLRLGSISLEPRWQVEANWALEYERTAQGEVRFLGYSHFVNERHAYAGNVLWTQEQLAAELGALVGTEALSELIALQCDFLSEALASSSYRGYIGVDLFVYRSGERLLLHPAVEINLRCTMGVLAHRAQLRDYPEGSPERFTLGYDLRTK